jgi:hypothetical protein
MIMQYAAFCDPSGGSHDSFPLAIAHIGPHGEAVLDGMWERKPPFSPDDVVREFSETLKSYRVQSVSGDRYAGEWPRERFREHGIEYTPSAKTKSEIFLEFLVLVNSGRVRIPSHARLRAQLVALERRTSRAGRDTVDHPPGGHDDVANVVAGACVLATAACVVYEPIICVLSLDGSDAEREREERLFRTRGFGGV